MGVAGSGKTTVGQALADALGWHFFDGDDFHPPSNIEKMAAGTPLTDEDRRPWLDQLNGLMKAEQAEGRCLVLACSALKESYRQRLGQGIPRVRFIHLRGDYELMHSRMRSRSHPYMKPEMLRSQFEALEAPRDAIEVDAAQPLEEIVADLVKTIA